MQKGVKCALLSKKFFDGGVLSHNCCQMCIIAKLKKKASLRQILEISKFCYFKLRTIKIANNCEDVI